MSIIKKKIQTEHAPAAVGPYSQAVDVTGGSRMIFCSGQIPLDPATNEIVGETIQEQTHRVMKNLEAVLAEAGASMNNIVKTTIYLTDLNDFAGMNEVYATFFSETPPARATAIVAHLPKGARLEIDALAVV